MTLFELYGLRSEDFIQGIQAALEYYGTGQGRLELMLYGKPVSRRVLQLEKQTILDDFTQDEKEIDIS